MANDNDIASSSGVPKYWKDLTVEEKLERMREIIKTIQNDRQKESGQISELYSKLFNHDHKDGKIVIPINLHNTFGGMAGLLASKSSFRLEKEQKGEVYF